MNSTKTFQMMLAVFAVSILAFCSSASAATIVVASGGSLETAINTANGNGDTTNIIQLQGASYTINGRPTQISKALTITYAPGNTAPILINKTGGSSQGLRLTLSSGTVSILGYSSASPITIRNSKSSSEVLLMNSTSSTCNVILSNVVLARPTSGTSSSGQYINFSNANTALAHAFTNLSLQGGATGNSSPLVAIGSVTGTPPQTLITMNNVDFSQANGTGVRIFFGHVNLTATSCIIASTATGNAVALDSNGSGSAGSTLVFNDCSFRSGTANLLNGLDAASTFRFYRPTFLGRCGATAFTFGTTASTVEIYGSIDGNPSASKTDLTPLFTAGTGLLAQLRAGTLLLQDLTATQSGSSGFVNSSGASLVGNPSITMNRCLWTNGAGRYACAATGGAYAPLLTATNTIWSGTSTATAYIDFSGSQTGAAGKISLVHSTLTGTLTGTAAELVHFKTTGSTDTVSVDASVMDGSGTTSGYVSQGTRPLTLATGGGPSIIWSSQHPTTAWSAGVPAGTLALNPNLDSTGHETANSAGLGRAGNKTQTLDVDGESRPQGDTDANDIGADESAFRKNPVVSSVVVQSGLTVDVTFSRPMGTGVTTAANYTLSGTGKGSLPANPVSVALVSGNTYRLTWTAREMWLGGDITITVTAANVQDFAGNTMGTPNAGTHAGAGIGVRPTATAIAPTTSSPTKSTTASFSVAFSESVQNFADATDVVVAQTGTLAHSGVTISGGPQNYTVDVTGVTGDGTMTLAAATASDIQDMAGNLLTSSVTSAAVTVDHTGPAATATPITPSPTSGTSVSFSVNFSEAVLNFNSAADLSITKTNTLAYTGTTISGGPQSYTVNVTGVTGDGTITLAANMSSDIADAAGNPLASSAVSSGLTVDQSAAVCNVITPTTASPTNAATVSFTVEFNENVVNFNSAADLLFTQSGTLAHTGAAVSGGPKIYTVNVTGVAGDGAMTLKVSTSSDVQDSVGHALASSVTSAAVTVDQTKPTVSTVQVRTGLTVDVTFSESLGAGATTAANYTVSGAGKGTLAANPASVALVGGSTYRLTWASGEMLNGGSITITAANIQDLAGNAVGTPNSATNAGGGIGVAPTVATSCTATNPTRTSPIPMTITFSENVTGFDVTDIVVGNATKSGFQSTDAAHYSVNLTPSGQGTVTADIAAGVATDGAGNSNLIAPQLARVYDSVAPTVSMSSTTSSSTNNTPISVTITFSEPVTGFVVSDIAVTNATAGNFAAIDAGHYTVELTPTADGAVTTNIAAGVANDLAGNPNAAAPAFSRTFDTVQPTVTISSTAGDPNNLSPMPVTLVFSEPVTGFAVDDISPTNATVANFHATDGAHYSFDLYPSIVGTVYVDIAEGVTQDAAGNPNVAAAEFSRKYDNKRPTATVDALVSSPTNSSTITLIVTFSEDVTGFDISEVVVTNATKSNFEGEGTDYTLDLTPIAQGLVTAMVPDNVAQSTAKNGNTASNTDSIFYDSLAPAGTLLINGGAPYTGTQGVSLTLNVSDTGSGVKDMQFSNDDALYSAWQAYAPSMSWALTAGDGTKTVYAQFRDNAGNTYKTSKTITLDTTAPAGSVSISTTTPGYVNSGTVSLALSAADGNGGSGVAKMRFSNDNSAWNGWAAYGTATSWALTAGDGAKTVYAQYQDSAGNVSTSYSASVTLDTVAPTGTISINTSTPGFVKSRDVTLNLGAADTGSGGVQMRFSNDNAAWSSWESAAAGKSWTLSGNDGIKTVYVQYRDAAGNVSGSYSDTIKLDATPPTGTMSIDGGAAYTGQSVVLLTIEDANNGGSGVTKMRFSNDGSAWSPWQDHGQTATWNLTPGDGLKTVYAQLQDGAGNVSAEPITASITLDTRFPGVLLTTLAGGATHNSFTVTATFTEGVTGFVAGDVAVTNGGVSAFIGASGDTTYTWTVTPGSEGPVAVSVPAGVCSAAGGAHNLNAASNTLSVLYDTTPPAATVSIDAGAMYTTSAAAILTMTATDGSSGVQDMRMSFSNEDDEASFTPWQPYAPTASWDLSAGDGTKTVYTQFRDGAGNVSKASDTIILDTTAPTGAVTIDNTGATPGFVNTAAVHLTLSAVDGSPGSGLDKMRFSNDNSTWGGEWLDYGISASWTLPAGDGLKTVYAQFKDRAGNVSTDTIRGTTTLYTAGPTGTMLIDGGAICTSSDAVTLTLSANDVMGLGVASMRFSNDGSTWSAWDAYSTSAPWTLAAGDKGPRTVHVQFRNTLGDESTSIISASIFFDPTRMTTVLSSSAPDSVTGPFVVSAAFAEPVRYFDASDVTVTNGTVGSFAGLGTSYNWTVTPTANGPLTVFVAAGVCQNVDFTQRPNEASNVLARTYANGIAPYLVLSTTATNPTNATSFPVTAVFSEAVTGFDAADIQVTNGAVSGFSGSGSSYGWTVTPAAEGTVSMFVGAGACSGAFDVANTASNTLARTYSPTAVTGTLLINNGERYTNAANRVVSLALTASPNVTRMRFSNDNAVWSAWEDYAVAKSWTLSAGDDDKTVYVQFSDGAQKTFTASDTVTLDTTPPSVMLTTSAPAAVHAPFTVVAHFSEAVTGFISSDMTMINVTVTNGSVSAFSGDGDSYTWTVIPTATGTVTVSVAAGVCNDPARNGNAASDTLSLYYSVPSAGTDSDHDGVIDSLDDFPDDATRAFTNVNPSKNTWGALAFEDNWPSKGDYDMNDLVIRYQVMTVTDYFGKIKDLEITARIQARGAQTKSGFGVEFSGLPKSRVASATLTTTDYSQGYPAQTQVAAVPENDPNNLTWIFFHDGSVYDPPHGNGTFLNTSPGSTRKSGAMFVLKMTFGTAQDPHAVGLPPYNPFIFSTVTPAREVHLPYQPPTQYALDNGVLKYFGTGDDNSSAEAGRFYVTNDKSGASGLPWALNLGESWNHPLETVQVSMVYPGFVPWTNSGGADVTDWYLRPKKGETLFYNYQTIAYVPN